MSDYHLLKTLNTNQHEAVTHVEGPLLLIAGAGTGKTRVLVHRILQLIESGAAKPEEILALTFTEKATTEMQERLDVLLPYGYCELHVKTFHGFCDMVLRESGLGMGLDTAYQILTQTDIALFLKENLFTFDLNYYRPLGNPLRFVSSLATHFGHLRDEMVSPKAYLDYAEQSYDFANDEVDRESAERELELAHAYNHYDELLLQNGVLDFASLNYLVLKLFRESPAILRRYQDQFKHILVDEFQDTNTAQNQLVELLSERHQNVMVVGDDDQSIYKWRGASLSNILHFEAKFKDCKKVVLTENYRSTQPILDMSYTVIQHNNPHRLEDREKINKKLIGQTLSESPKKPHVIHFEHYLEEAQFVTEQIERHVQTQKGIHYRDCAILVRATAHAVPFIEALTQAEIPYHFSGSQGLYQRSEIKDLLALLRALSNPYDDIALFRLLSIPTFGFESEYILSLVHKAKTSSTPLLQILKQSLETPDLFSLVGTGSGLEGFLDLYHSLQKTSKNHPTSHLLGVFLKGSGYLADLQNVETPDHAEKLQNLATFSQIIKTFEETYASSRLLECLDYLQSRLNMGDRPSPNEESLDSNTVKVLTVHAAKGLEFDTVFVVNLAQHRFPSTNRREAFEIPEKLLPDIANEETTHLHEERRLFYVAATRAKKHLFLTYSNTYGGKKRWKPSIFLEESIDSGMVDLTEGGSKLLGVSPGNPIAASDAQDEKPILFSYERQHRSLSLSFSRIDTFQTCPLKYKFRYLYRLAEPASHPASFGSSVHNALNGFYQELKNGQPPSLDRLKELYDKHWIPLGYTNRAHHNARKKQGWEMLQTFYEANSNPWLIPAYLERPFTLKTETGLRVSGRIDRIDKLPDGTYEVIDYKTGRLKEQKEVDRDIQLSIYALACQKLYRVRVSKLSLYYLADNQKLSTIRTDVQLAETESELDEIAQTIQTSSFEASPSPFACQYCDYALVCDKSMA